MRSNSEANLLSNDAYYYGNNPSRSAGHREASAGRESRAAQSDIMMVGGMRRPSSKAGSQFSVASVQSRASAGRRGNSRSRTPAAMSPSAAAVGNTADWQVGGFGVSMRPDGVYASGAVPMLDDKFFPRDREFGHQHGQHHQDAHLALAASSSGKIYQLIYNPWSHNVGESTVFVSPNIRLLLGQCP